MNTSATATTLVRQVVRQLLREIAAVPADGQHSASSTQLSDPRLYLRVNHRELEQGDPLLENSPIVSTSGERHHLYESFALALPGAAGAAGADESLDGAAGAVDSQDAQDVLYDTLYTLANPVHSYPYGDSTGLLVSPTAYQMLQDLLALRADEEMAYLAKTFSRAAWVGNNRGMHEPMGVLVRQVTRHPAFTVEELLIRQPISLLFLTHRGYLNAVRRYGVSPDVQEAPTRGFYAVDTQSYADCRLLLSRIHGLIAVEFTYQGPCLRGISPLNVPIYRIPEAIPLENIRSVVEASTNRDLWQQSES